MESRAAAPETAIPGSSAPAAPGFPYPARYVDLPAGRMRCVDTGGAGDPVLFVHGTPTWSYEWRHLLAALPPGRRGLAPDHLGFGHSDRPRDFPYTPEAHAENLLALVRRLDLRRLTLVVHDFGGPIGLPVALAEPERVERLVVVNSWIWSLADDADMAKKARLAGGALGRFLYRRANFSLRTLMPYAYGDRRRLTPEIHRAYLERFPDAWSRGAVLWPLAKSLLGSSDFYADLWAKRERLCGKPALIVWGLKDRAFEPRLLARWREALPRAEVLELPESGHWPHEEEPDRVAAALRRFLA